MHRFRASLLFLPVGGTLAAAAALLASHKTPPGVFAPNAALGNGKVQTFVTLDSANDPVAAGARFTAGLLTDLPDTNAPFTLGLGPDAVRTPFTHIYFDWVPRGHAPGGVYDRPHLDFHFYFSSLEERLAVAGGLDSTPPPAQTLPPDYAKVTESVTFMGTHFGDTTAHEFHGAPFDKVLLYGSHDGRITFLDLMVTKAWLETKPNVVVTIKQPAAYPARGYYPTQFHVTYDSATATYVVALEGFILR